VRIGITGTRNGLSEYQKYQLQILIGVCTEAERLVHGDCVGADTEVAMAFKQRFGDGVLVVARACNIESARANCEANDIVLPAKPPMDRNDDIVADSDVLLAFPKENYEVLRSGTWATVRRAKKARKPVFMVYPE
jgi:hypothetical protein